MVRYRNHTPQEVDTITGAGTPQRALRSILSGVLPPSVPESSETAQKGLPGELLSILDTIRRTRVKRRRRPHRAPCAPCLSPTRMPYEGRHRASCAACGLCQLNPLNATHRTTERPERNKAYADPNPSESLRGRHLASSNPPPAHSWP